MKQTHTKIIAVMAVFAMMFCGVGFAFAEDISADDPAPAADKDVTVTFIGFVEFADVKKVLNLADTDKANVKYVTTVNQEAVENMSIMNYNTWELLEGYLDDGKFIFTASEYGALASDVQKKVVNGLKAFGMDDTKTVYTLKNQTKAAAYELYTAGQVDAMILAASTGGFTQAQLDAAVAAATAGLFTQTQVDAMIAEALADVPVQTNDDATIWMAIAIILIIALVALGGFMVFIAYKANKAGRSLLE